MRLYKARLAGMIIGAAGICAAQGTPNPQQADIVVTVPVEGSPVIEKRVIVRTMEGARPAGAPSEHGHTAAFSTFEFVEANVNFPGNVVKGAPYSASTVTETTQVLGDGNRIFRQNTAAVYRDGEGRTRRETEFKNIGPLASSQGGTKLILIFDPVENVSYTLNEKDRTARKMPGGGALHAMPLPPLEGGKGMGGSLSIHHMARPLGDAAGPKGEPLGTKLIEGVKVEGTRTSHTIPAGEIGNDRPIEITSERWYSPELKLLVISKNADPRMGETVFKLTNIRREEPSQSLFQVPAGYTLLPEPTFERATPRPVREE